MLCGSRLNRRGSVRLGSGSEIGFGRCRGWIGGLRGCVDGMGMVVSV